MSRALAAAGRQLGQRALDLRDGYLDVLDDVQSEGETSFAKFREKEARKGLLFLDNLSAKVYGLGKDLQGVEKTPFADTIRRSAVPVFNSLISAAEGHLQALQDKETLKRRLEEQMGHEEHMSGLGFSWPWESAADAVTGAASAMGDAAKSTVVDVALIGFGAWAVVKLLSRSGKK